MPTSGRRSIQVFSSTVHFAVDRSPRRRNITIEIAPGGQVVVKAPLRTSASEVDRVVWDNARWILTKLADAATNKPAQAQRRFVDGEELTFRGDDYKLKLSEASSEFPVGEVRLEGDNIAVATFLELGSAERVEAIRSSLLQWYRHQAQAYLPARVAHYADLLGVEVRQVLIRDQQRRWGSCNSQGVLRFNYRIIIAPPRVTDYVVAHEVCHLLEMNHSAAYWANLERVMPDYRARRHELKRIGGTLVL